MSVSEQLTQLWLLQQASGLTDAQFRDAKRAVIASAAGGDVSPSRATKKGGGTYQDRMRQFKHSYSHEGGATAAPVDRSGGGNIHDRIRQFGGGDGGGSSSAARSSSPPKASSNIRDRMKAFAGGGQECYAVVPPGQGDQGFRDHQGYRGEPTRGSPTRSRSPPINPYEAPTRAAAPTRAVPHDPRSGGAEVFLTYDSANNGTLFTVYSKDPVPGAIAYAKPGKSIPGFKFKRGGRSEIARGVGGGRDATKEYYKGIAMWVKAMKAHQGSVTLNSRTAETQFKCFLHRPNNSVVEVTGRDQCLDGFDCVAVVRGGVDDFEGARTLTKEIFMVQANKKGGNCTI